MSERASWVEKHRDAFELLVSAAMNRITEGPRRSGDESIARQAARTAGANMLYSHVSTENNQNRDNAPSVQNIVSPSNYPCTTRQNAVRHGYGNDGFPAETTSGTQSFIGPPAAAPQLPNNSDVSHMPNAPSKVFFDDGAAYGPPEGGGSQDDAMRIVGELAQWIEQDQNSTLPVWMPNFEQLDNGGRHWAQ
ncbi:hypothetical protein MBLNU230_g0694t1 [Neophaeotheca triangularis]